MNVERRRLEADAREAATFHGHDLQPFVLDKYRPSVRSRAFCRKCGRGVYIDVAALENDADVCGEAVAVECEAARI